MEKKETKKIECDGSPAEQILFLIFYISEFWPVSEKSLNMNWETKCCLFRPLAGIKVESCFLKSHFNSKCIPRQANSPKIQLGPKKVIEILEWNISDIPSMIECTLGRIREADWKKMGVTVQSFECLQGLGKCLQLLSLDICTSLIPSSFDKARQAWDELNGPCVKSESPGTRAGAKFSLTVTWMAEPTPCSAWTKKKKKKK